MFGDAAKCGDKRWPCAEGACTEAMDYGRSWSVRVRLWGSLNHEVFAAGLGIFNPCRKSNPSHLVAMQLQLPIPV